MLSALACLQLLYILARPHARSADYGSQDGTNGTSLDRVLWLVVVARAWAPVEASGDTMGPDGDSGWGGRGVRKSANVVRLRGIGVVCMLRVTTASDHDSLRCEGR